MTCIDGFVLAVTTAHDERYRKHAARVVLIPIEFGATTMPF